MIEARYSKKVKDAFDGLYKLEKEISLILKREYPLGSFVRVIHSRGEYFGYVVDHSFYGASIAIRNCKSGKILYRWYREVELSGENR